MDEPSLAELARPYTRNSIELLTTPVVLGFEELAHILDLARRMQER